MEFLLRVIVGVESDELEEPPGPRGAVQDQLASRVSDLEWEAKGLLHYVTEVEVLMAEEH